MSLIEKFAGNLGVEAGKMLSTLKKTAFKQSGNKEITNEQMMALLVVADKYKLNPFTKEIYAFPSNGAINPIVSIDGWMKMINDNPAFDGMQFEDVVNEGNLIAIKCKIFRKDRSHPVEVTEYMEECKRGSDPWKKWPSRMLRHKAAIQCARYAFSFSGLYDPDEEERIREAKEVSDTSPDIQSFSTEQKQYFDLLITNNDEIGMYVFKETVPESEFISLYSSFEKGKKGQYRKIIDGLVNKGHDQFCEAEAEMHQALANGDIFGVMEFKDGLGDAAFDLAVSLFNAEQNLMYREIGDLNG